MEAPTLLSHSPASQLVSNTVSVCDENKTTNSAECGRHVQHPVRVDVKIGFNLRHATRRWRELIEKELPRRLVVTNHRTLPLKAWMRILGWLSACIMNVCPFSVEKVSLRSISFVMTSPVIFKPIVKGAPSKSSKSCTCEDPSPVRVATCTAAPKSSEGLPLQAVPQSPSRRTSSGRSLQAHCRYCCCCFSVCGGKVEYDMQGIAFFSSISPLFPFLPSPFLPLSLSG